MRGDLDCIVMKALEKDRDDRYATAQSLADDLRRYLQDKPIQATKPTLAQRVSKWSRRHKPVVWSAVATLIVGRVALATSTVMIASAYERERQQGIETQKALRLAEEQQRLAEQQRKLAEGQRKEAIRQQQEVSRLRDMNYRNLYVAHMRVAQQDWEIGRVARLQDLLYQHLPEPGRADLRGWEWYYLLSLCYGYSSTLKGDIDEVTTIVAWSPDGERLVALVRGDAPYTENDLSSIVIWDLVHDEMPATIGERPGITEVAWSHDNVRIATIVGGTIKVYDASIGYDIARCRHDLMHLDTATPDVPIAYVSKAIDYVLDNASPAVNLGND